MTKNILSLILLIVLNVSFGQKKVISEISSMNPNDSVYSDFENLDINFERLTIISLGESTHGTKEFTLMRHRLFKYLVEKYNYNTLFLEIDFAFGLLANSYINNEKDYSDEEVVASLKYWPSQSVELLDLFKWMKFYNKSHSNKLKIIGTEGQDFYAPFSQIIDFFTLKGIPFEPDTAFFNRKIYNERFLDKSLTKKLFSCIDNSKTHYFSKYDGISDSLFLIQLENTLKQSIQKKSAEYPKNQILRNQFICDNILFQVNNYSNTKGMYIAHNGHIHNKKHYKFYGVGHYLKKQIGNQYFSIAQDFFDGSFLALQYDPSIKKYNVKTITIENDEEYSLTKYYNTSYKNVAFIMVKEIKAAKKLKLHVIGSVLETKHGIPFEKNIKGYDGVILIKKSTPLDLLLVDEETVQ